MRYDAEHKERTRRRILNEAATAIRIKGPTAIGIAEIMSSLGLTHGGFYAHFQSKDDLVAHAVTYMFDERYSWFLSKTEALEPKVALKAFIDGYLSKFHRDTLGCGCAIAALAGDLSRMNDSARRRFMDGSERLSKSVVELLRRAGVKSPESTSWSILAELTGTILLARATNNSKHSDVILRNSREALKARLGVKHFL